MGKSRFSFVPFHHSRSQWMRLEGTSGFLGPWPWRSDEELKSSDSPLPPAASHTLKGLLIPTTERRLLL